MPTRSALMFGILLFLPSLGLAQKVRFDFDRGADFTKFHTYRLVKLEENKEVNQLVDQRILGAIQEELAKEGFRRVETGGDLLVGYQASVTHEQQYTTFNDGVGPGWGYGARWGGTGISTTTSTTIPTGALTVNLFDPAQKQLVFRGIATSTLSDKPEKNAKTIKKAVQKIFEKYPPKA